VAADRFNELQDQRPARLVLERFEPKGGAARVLEDAEHESRSSIQRGFPGEIECPAVTWAQARAIIQHRAAQGVPALQSLRYTQGATGGGDQVGPFGGNTGGRYIWTKQRGWVDLAHFFQVAAEAESQIGTGWKQTAAATIGRPYANHKLWQKTKEVENAQHGETRWSYEDPSSNKAGLDFFLDYYKGDQSLLDRLDAFFKDAGAGRPQNAPNWKTMQQRAQPRHWFAPTESMDPVLNPQRIDPRHQPPEKTVE